MSERFNPEAAAALTKMSCQLMLDPDDPVKKFQIVSATGEIEEFECRMSDIEFPADGGLILPPIRTLNIRYGSIYDHEGSD